MIEFDLFDNLIDFIDELYILLKEDWIKFKLFVKENKNYILWLFIALITLQFTDIMNLGSSWDKYCKKNNIQYGGGNNNIKSAETLKAQKKQLKAEKKAKSKKESKQAGSMDEGKKAGLAGSMDEGKKAGLAGSIAEAKKAGTMDDAKKAASMIGGPDGEDSVKSIDKKLGFFNKMKGKIKDSAGQHGFAGPVLGNLEGVFGAVGGMFTFAAVLLMFLGILSLPVLVFLILTYSVIKMMVGKLAIY